MTRLLFALMLGPSSLSAYAAKPTVVPAESVHWEQLNPARGDKSPKAATLWGDRTGSVPTGFLVQFVDGFSSPPHIHNVSYRGVVISGLVHNDDPNAPELLMPAGSYWTQPKGAAHITSAKGSPVVAYIEIEDGPYLVRPVDSAFETPERPINVDASNLVWLKADELAQMSEATGGANVSFLWGNTETLGGSLVQLPPGFEGMLHSGGADIQSVVIQGNVRHNGRQTLRPSSYFASTGRAEHNLKCTTDEPCLLYVRAGGVFRIVQ